MSLQRLAFLGFGLVLITNAWMLAHAWYNKREITQSIVLGKQELAAFKGDSRFYLRFSYPVDKHGLSKAQTERLNITCENCMQEGWAQFELAGDLYRKARDKALDQPDNFALESRLYVKAVSLSKEDLSAEATANTLILPVSIRYYSSQNANIRLKQQNLHIPFEDRQRFFECQSPSLTVAWGQLDIPWVKEVKCL